MAGMLPRKVRAQTTGSRTRGIRTLSESPPSLMFAHKRCQRQGTNTGAGASVEHSRCAPRRARAVCCSRIRETPRAHGPFRVSWTARLLKQAQLGDRGWPTCWASARRRHRDTRHCTEVRLSFSTACSSAPHEGQRTGRCDPCGTAPLSQQLAQEKLKRAVYLPDSVVLNVCAPRNRYLTAWPHRVMHNHTDRRLYKIRSDQIRSDQIRSDSYRVTLGDKIGLQMLIR